MPEILWAGLALLLLLQAGLLWLVIKVLQRTSAESQRIREQYLRDELRLARQEASDAARDLREELVHSQKSGAELVVTTIGTMSRSQQTGLDAVVAEIKQLAAENEARLEKMRDTVDLKLKQIQESNEAKLEQMRRTVDEKLHDTLEKRLGHSFKLVSQQLEAVQSGLGEMRNLATGVGDLKKVLSNVKTRGTLGEIQLGAILEEILTTEQYARNVQTKPSSREFVEFAVRLPGTDDQPGSCIWLPIDSKFPQEDYQRYVDAAEIGDGAGVTAAVTAFVRTVRASARDIQEKYLSPPQTTDFGIMFLPTEGLYAEILRQPGLVTELMRDHRVIVAGPTTLAAILNSLRMGFRTLAIEQRSSEVWQVLAAVKTEFGKFGDVLDRLKRQLTSATRTVDDTGVRTRAMERKLREVEQLPADRSAALLQLEQADGAEVDPVDENR